MKNCLKCIHVMVCEKHLQETQTANPKDYTEFKTACNNIAESCQEYQS